MFYSDLFLSMYENEFKYILWLSQNLPTLAENIVLLYIVLPWYLYYMVTQNMLRTHKGK